MGHRNLDTMCELSQGLYNMVVSGGVVAFFTAHGVVTKCIHYNVAEWTCPGHKTERDSEVPAEKGCQFCCTKIQPHCRARSSMCCWGFLIGT